MMHRNYKGEWSLLTVAILFTVSSFIFDMYFYSNWFGRSGAVVVGLAAVVEFRIAGHIYDDIQRSQFLNKTIEMSVPLAAKPTKGRKRVSTVAHVFLLIGTTIWGYGDLLWPQT